LVDELKPLASRNRYHIGSTASSCSGNVRCGGYFSSGGWFSS
jgi:hypothetical protein